MANTTKDAKYLKIILTPLHVCMNYKPKFGHSGKNGGFNLKEFRAMYRKDSFYTWFGLDSQLIYSAHKAAGGITSIYRQIGNGCELLFNQIVREQLELTEEEANWSYQVPTSAGKSRTLNLDARIVTSDLAQHKRKIFKQWLRTARQKAGLTSTTNLNGAVFEVRQGYKSKDSKRQNADLGNAASAYSNDYLPVLALLSTQIDDDIYDRYLSHNWLILQGLPKSNDAHKSVYAFSKNILDYDLAAFFKRNSPEIKTEVEKILVKLLSAD